MDPRERGAGTDAVHAGELAPQAHHALTAPIVQTATYTFRDTAELIDHMEGRIVRDEYGRYGNPTVRQLEAKLAALEGADEALFFSSGMAALTASVLAFVKSGSHVVLFADCYRRTRQFLEKFLERFGVETTVIPPADVAALAAALRPETRLVIAEAPTNPYLMVVDLPAVAALCRPKRVRVLVDATFATPVNLRPLTQGADLVVHSATKYLAGHNDVLAGAVAGPAHLVSLVRDVRHVTGGVLDPHAAYLVLRGMKSLPLRVERQNATALRLSRALEAHPNVRRVWYPGLASHPSHAVASRLLAGGGGVVTFEVAGDVAATSKVIDACRIPRIAPSLGGVESLIEQPAIMSYYELDSASRQAVGISDSLVRYAVGIEDAADLEADLLAALAS